MANKQQKQLRKNNMASCNGGAYTTIRTIEHGPRAFLPPDAAKARLKERGSRSWKVTGRHPANVQQKKGK